MANHEKPFVSGSFAFPSLYQHFRNREGNITGEEGGVVKNMTEYYGRCLREHMDFRPNY